MLVLGALFRGKFLDGLSRLVKRGEVVPPEEMDLEQAKALIERLRAKADSTSSGEGEPTPNASVPAA